MGGAAEDAPAVDSADAADELRPAADGGGRLKVVLVGPPGSGKGTQAGVLSQRLAVPAISTGDMLRDAVTAGTELGRRVEGVMAAGGLVDDETMAQVVRERLDRREDRSGFLLDGYPRTVPQAEMLDQILGATGERLDAVLLVQVPEAELVRRAVARRRGDDREDVVRERLRIYRERTAPLIGYYDRRGLLLEVDGDRPIGEVTSRILEALGSTQPVRRARA